MALLLEVRRALHGDLPQTSCVWAEQLNYRWTIIVHTSEIPSCSWSLEAGFVTGAVTAVGVVAQFVEGDARLLVAVSPRCFPLLSDVIGK